MGKGRPDWNQEIEDAGNITAGKEGDSHKLIQYSPAKKVSERSGSAQENRRTLKEIIKDSTDRYLSRYPEKELSVDDLEVMVEDHDRKFEAGVLEENEDNVRKIDIVKDIANDEVSLDGSFQYRDGGAAIVLPGDQ